MTPPLTRAGGAAAGALCLAALAACGGSSNNTSSSSSTSSSGAATGAVDSCLAGVWVSSAVSGTVGGKPAKVTGGTGEKLTIGADGSINVDDSNVTVLTINAGGQTAQVKQSGQGSGKATTSGSSLTVTLDQGSTLENQTLDANGNPVGTPQPGPNPITVTYRCTRGQQLQIIQPNDNTTVTYTPGSSATPT